MVAAVSLACCGRLAGCQTPPVASGSPPAASCCCDPIALSTNPFFKGSTNFEPMKSTDSFAHFPPMRRTSFRMPQQNCECVHWLPLLSHLLQVLSAGKSFSFPCCNHKRLRCSSANSPLLVLFPKPRQIHSLAPKRLD